MYMSDENPAIKSVKVSKKVYEAMQTRPLVTGAYTDKKQGLRSVNGVDAEEAVLIMEMAALGRVKPEEQKEGDSQRDRYKAVFGETELTGYE